jgi:hypothetical protein
VLFRHAGFCQPWKNPWSIVGATPLADFVYSIMPTPFRLPIKTWRQTVYTFACVKSMSATRISELPEILIISTAISAGTSLLCRIEGAKLSRRASVFESRRCSLDCGRAKDVTLRLVHADERPPA